MADGHPAPAGVTAQATDPIAIATAFGQAENAHDVERTVALFADDAVVETPFGNFTGKEQIRQFIQSLVAGNIQTVGRDYRASGDQVSFISAATTDDFRRMGVAPVDFRIEGTVREGKIQRWIVSLTPESAARLQAAQAASQPQPQPKPGGPAPKPGPAAPKPGAAAPKPGQVAPAAAPVQAPKALPRTGEAENWLIGGLAVAGIVLLGAGLVARRRSI